MEYYTQTVSQHIKTFYKMWCSNTYQTLHVVTRSHGIFYEWISRFVSCASQTQENVKHLQQIHGVGILMNTCQIYWQWVSEGFNNSKTESGILSEGKKSPLTARIYNNTRIMTVLKWINWWYCTDKTGDGQMQISCGTVTFFFFCTVQETHM